MHALFESVWTRGVKGSHCGGGFFVVKDGGSKGSCIAAVDAIRSAVVDRTQFLLEASVDEKEGGRNKYRSWELVSLLRANSDF